MVVAVGWGVTTRISTPAVGVRGKVALALESDPHPAPMAAAATIADRPMAAVLRWRENPINFMRCPP